MQTENEYKKSWISSQIDNETHQKPKQLPYHNPHIQPYLSFDMSRTTVALCLALIQLASSKALSPRWNNSVQNVLDQALVALGGENVIQHLVESLTPLPRRCHHLRSEFTTQLTRSSVYRSRSLMQSYNLYHADTPVAVSGSQNISFSFDSGELTQRIDRKFHPSGN